MFAWVKDYQIPSRTTIMRAKVDSGREYKKDLLMQEEKIIQFSKFGGNLP